MYKLSISFGPGVWALMFKTKEKADVAWTALIETHSNKLTAGPELTAEDDFGQKIKMNPNAISGLMLEDLDQSKLAHIEDALHRGRVQANIQQRASSDPTLKTAAMMGNGPAMISPMGRG